MVDVLEELKKKTQQPVVTQINQPSLNEHHQVLPAEKPVFSEEIKHPPLNGHFSEFAVASFILGIIGLILQLFSPLAIIMGVGGLMQHHRGMKGQWMAWVGIVLGLIGIAMIVAAIIFGMSFLQEYLIRFGGVESLIGRAKGSLVG